MRNGECEIVSLESRAKNRGAGTRLIEVVMERARAEGCARVFIRKGDLISRPFTAMPLQRRVS
ncbi:GNAT family N-acetyltransferase [Paenibacillus durus]|uniref:GNAT family N-acetyltransferase n=1 Tax=Paenibacillus durus TaxID=44251 RepID=UPI002E80445E|nr:GNAT family N-acetyltransferase [Paenibacillus durus]